MKIRSQYLIDFKLIWLLTISNMKSRYRKTVAGFIWVVLNPLLMLFAQSFIFSFLLKINVRDYTTFLLTGLLPWIFITQSLEMGVPVLDDMRDTIKNLDIPPFVFIAAKVLDNFINFIFAFLIVFIPSLFFKLDLNIFALLSIISILITFLSVNFLVFILSLFNIFYRDIRFIISFVINIMFFLTPVFYPRTIFPERFQFLVDLNPFYILIAPFRLELLSAPPQQLVFPIIKSIIFLLLLFVLSIIVWKKNKHKFYLCL